MITRALRAVGWTLVAVGAVLLLYVVYLLFYTNLETDRAQSDLRDSWNAQVGELPGEPDGRRPDPTDVPEDEEVEAEAEVEVGEAYAAMWFERPGSDVTPVHDEPLFVVRGVSLTVLRRGPGHYADSAAPGQPGNFAVAGHRTTYGAPFYHLDQLLQGDLVHVLDRQGRHWRYRVHSSRTVRPSELWVVGDDPLATGTPMLTLTTCHPRFSAAQRLVVFAELEGEVDEDGELVEPPLSEPALDDSPTGDA